MPWNIAKIKQVLILILFSGSQPEKQLKLEISNLTSTTCIAYTKQK